MGPPQPGSPTAMLSSPPGIGAASMQAPAARRRASLLEEEPACSSRLRRIFRYALGRVLDTDGAVAAADEDGGPANANAASSGDDAAAVSAGMGVKRQSSRGLEAEAKARLPSEVLSLLERLVEAERAAATGAQGHGYWPSSSVGTAAPAEPQQAPHQQPQRRPGGLASGKKRRLRESLGGGGKPRRRVSFSTFDLSVVDTPDPQRHGSDRPMEGVLSSLFLALKAAEALRAECHPGAAEAQGMGGGMHGGMSALQQLMAAAAGVMNGGVGKENEHHHQRGQPRPSQGAGAGVVGKPEGPLADAGDVGGSAEAAKECLERLVAALGELATYAGLAAAGKAPEAGGNNGDQRRALALLGEHPNWSEVAAAASFYAKELRLLCLEPAEALPASRLLERYHETLSSMVRYELKKVLNLCYCGATGFGDDDAASNMPHQHANVNAAGAAGPGALDACCSALQIMMETAANLQYNSDDPAALVHFALQRLASKRPAWLAFVEAAGVGAGAAGAERQQDAGNALRWGAESKGGEDGDTSPRGRFVLGAEGEEDSNLMSLASQPDNGAPSQRMQELGDEEDGEPGVAKRRRSSSVSSLPFPAPRWWALAEAQGEEVLGYLSAASFLLRVLQDPVVAKAVGQGKWGRVERFAGMVSGVFGVPSEDDCLRALGDLVLFGEHLEGELQAAQAVREALVASVPPEVLAAVPPSHFPALGGGAYHAQHASKKRKRAARLLKGHMRNVLIWAHSFELPPALTYPQMMPLCVYAPPMPEPGEEEEEEGGFEGGAHVAAMEA